MAHIFKPRATFAREVEMNEKSTEKAARPHSLQLSERGLLTVTGVKAVPVFTDKLIEIELDAETLNVTGHDLNVKGLDLDGGKLSASGRVTAVRYSSAPAPSSLFKRLFK